MRNKYAKDFGEIYIADDEKHDSKSAGDKCDSKATPSQSPFNGHGVVDKPDFIVARPKQSDEQIEFTVKAHPLDVDCWIAEPSWHCNFGHVPGHSIQPSRASATFQTRSEAVADALNRGIRQIKADLGDLQDDPKWRKRLDSLCKWTATAIEQVRQNDDQLPLRNCTVVDLACGGLGGFGLGLKELGAKVLLGCDIDPTARAMYQANVQPVSMHDDICTLDGAEIECDILTMGLMCQAFSVAGKGLGLEDPKLAIAYKHSLRLLSEIKAKVVIIECVRQLLTLNDGDDADMVRQTLLLAGYRVQHRTLNTKGFGLPQNRVRAFIVATKNGTQFDSVLGYLFPNEKQANTVVADVIDEHLPATIDPDRLQVIRPEPTQREDRLIEVARVDGKNSQGYRVYSPLGLGPTLTAMGGGNGPTGLYLVNGKARPLTAREAYRMQGMPEWTEHHEKRTHACRHAGNAVAVPVVRELGRMLSTTIASIDASAAKAAAVEGGAV